MIRRVVLGVTVVALAAVPAGSAAAGPLDGAKECVENGKTAVRYILQGTPQPQECDPV